MPEPGKETMTVIVQAMGRCHMENLTRTAPFYETMTTGCNETFPVTKQEMKEYDTAVADLRLLSAEYIRKSDEMPNESQFALDNIHNDILITNFICTNTPIKIEEKMELLKADTMYDRVLKLLRILNRDIQFFDLQHEIRSKTREDLDEQQREYFLQQQIKNIKEELGNGEGTTEKIELEEKAKGKKWPEDIEQIFRKELDKLDLFNPQRDRKSVV